MKFAWAIFACLLFFSCKDKFENPSANAAAIGLSRYFPLSAGRYVIYDVDSIVHETPADSANNPDSLIVYYYQIKEQLDSSFIDLQGQVEWYLSRWERANDTLPWQFLNIWTRQLTFNSAQQVEDNLRYIKLSYPMDKDKTWNGNAYNPLPEEDYYYSVVNAPISIGGFNFDSSATVMQDSDFNLLYEVLQKEKYVCGVGMVYKEADSLNLNGLLDTTNGFEYRMTLNDYFPK